MTGFETKEQLEADYALELRTGGMDKTVAEIMAEGKAVYVPHVYRGGWVIRGFGYSTERVGKYVAADRAGNPAAV